jgi:hypothetical protein
VVDILDPFLKSGAHRVHLAGGIRSNPRRIHADRRLVPEAIDTESWVVGDHDLRGTPPGLFDVRSTDAVATAMPSF